MKHDLSHCRGVYWESPLHEEEEQTVNCSMCLGFGDVYVDAYTGDIETLDVDCSFEEFELEQCPRCLGVGLITK